MNLTKIYLVMCITSLAWLAYAEASGVVLSQAAAYGPGRMFGGYQHK